MKQPEDNKTSDMFDLDASHNRMPIQASLSKDDQIAKAINNHVRYVNSFSRTGSWTGKRGGEYWSTNLNKHVYEPEMKRMLRSHMERTLKKIKEITK